ncbi:MAG: FliG C-terminal domain-containing protein [Treponema sp.]
MSDLESEIQRRGLIKVSRDDAVKENSYRRVAKFLYLIGEEQAAKVLQKLTRDQIEKVVAEMLTIRYVDKDEAAYILSEFTALYNDAKNSFGGVETAEGILTAAFGGDKAQEIIERAVPPVPERPFDFLDGIDGEKLTRILADELPATQALVISQLEPKTAAAYIMSLPDTAKKDIVLRLARLETLNPEILRTVSTSMREKLTRIQTGSLESVDGRAVLAAILRKSSCETEQLILEQIAGENPELEQDIRERLFTFEDVLLADDRFLQKKLSGMQDADIAALVSYKPEEFVRKIFKNISYNRRTFILDEQAGNTVSTRTCREITDRFLRELRESWENGDLILYGKDGDDIWIT